MPEFGTIPYLLAKTAVYLAAVALVTFLVKKCRMPYLMKVMKPCIILQAIGFNLVAFAIAWFKSRQMERIGAGMMLFTFAVYAGALLWNATVQACWGQDPEEFIDSLKGGKKD